MIFIPAPVPQSQHPHSYLICVAGDSLLVRRNHSWEPLHLELLAPIAGFLDSSHYLGTYRGQSCHVVQLPVTALDNLDFEWVGLRTQLGEIPDHLFQLAGRAIQVINWDSYHRFCGRCGSPTRLDSEDRAKVCDACQAFYYPRLSPCVIVVVERGDYCLLAHNSRSRTQKYSALAGFIEPGETVEQALEREVKEEVGVAVTNVRYFASQPWPFPGQLMLGFHADYAGGEIQVDQVEIDDAQWFHARQLPLTPPPSTISGQLIQDFVQRTCGA